MEWSETFQGDAEDEYDKSHLAHTHTHKDTDTNTPSKTDTRTRWGVFNPFDQLDTQL